MAYSLGLKSQINFGKYRGMYVDTVVKMDPKYVLWVDENTHHRFGKVVLKRASNLLDKPEY